MLDHVFLSVRDTARSVAFYSAANVFDPDGYSVEFVHKPWQQTQP
jgi:hypothetical protein